MVRNLGNSPPAAYADGREKVAIATAVPKTIFVNLSIFMCMIF